MTTDWLQTCGPTSLRRDEVRHARARRAWAEACCATSFDGAIFSRHSSSGRARIVENRAPQSGWQHRQRHRRPLQPALAGADHVSARAAGPSPASARPRGCRDERVAVYERGRICVQESCEMVLSGDNPGRLRTPRHQGEPGRSRRRDARKAAARTSGSASEPAPIAPARTFEQVGPG